MCGLHRVLADAEWGEVAEKRDRRAEAHTDSRRLTRLGAEPQGRPMCPHFGEAGADRRLSGDERRASRRATLLAVEVCEHRTFFGDPVDVGRPISHQAVVVAARVEPANVVGHDEKNVGFFGNLLHFFWHRLFLL